MTAEILLGSVAVRERLARRLDDLYQIKAASIEQTRLLIEGRRLWSVGIGYVDANLLASALLTPGTMLLSRDKRLHAQAERLGVACPAPSADQ